MTSSLRSKVRWYELLPEVVLLGGLTLFGVTEFRAATSALKSGQAVLLMALVTAAWTAARLVLWRIAPWPLIRAIPFAIGALLILKVVVLPAYTDKTVVETLAVAPIVTSTVPATTLPTTTLPTTTTPAPAGPQPTPTTEPPTTTTTTTEPAPAAPVLLRTSTFHGIDHRASGTVNIYRQPDGSYVVGLEGIDIQPGPDYDVYVVPGVDKEDRSGGTRIDDLRGNKGTQFYEVRGPSLEDGPWTVLVWCDTFAVPVAGATPA